jgi:hypothetical protein
MAAAGRSGCSCASSSECLRDRNVPWSLPHATRSLGPFSSLTPGLWARPRVYQPIRARESGHADALERLGVGCYQRGQSPDAVELIGKAVALRLDVAARRADLAGTYRALEQFHRATGCCRASPLL